MRPIRPMLAASADRIPPGMAYEPKWDGWRCLTVVAGGTVRLWSRRGTELTGDFPDLVAAAQVMLPPDCVVDGEIVMITGGRLEYSQLARRHGAGARATRLARELPVTYVLFDVLELAGRDLRPEPQRTRRSVLEDLLAEAVPPLVLTPATNDLATAQKWFAEFERFGLDGIVAKPPGQPYLEGARSMVKVKHQRTADVVVGGFRLDRNATPSSPTLGSLLLGAFTDGPDPQLHLLGVSSGFPQSQRVPLGSMLGELEVGRDSPGFADHPWHPSRGRVTRVPDGVTTWSQPADRAHLIEPLLTCEITYDALHPDPTGVRFRSNAAFVRWRVDKDPTSCRLADLLVDQGLDSATPAPLASGLTQWLSGEAPLPGRDD